MKRTVDDLMHELDCISTTLAAVGYAFDGVGDVDLTKTSAQNIVFGCACYIERIIEDMTHLEDYSTEREGK